MNNEQKIEELEDVIKMLENKLLDNKLKKQLANKKFYQKHGEKMYKYSMETIVHCEACNRKYRLMYMSVHRKSKKHLRNARNLAAGIPCIVVSEETNFQK